MVLFCIHSRSCFPCCLTSLFLFSVLLLHLWSVCPYCFYISGLFVRVVFTSVFLFSVLVLSLFLFSLWVLPLCFCFAYFFYISVSVFRVVLYLCVCFPYCFYILGSSVSSDAASSQGSMGSGFSGTGCLGLLMASECTLTLNNSSRTQMYLATDFSWMNISTEQSTTQATAEGIVQCNIAQDETTQPNEKRNSQHSTTTQ